MEEAPELLYGGRVRHVAFKFTVVLEADNGCWEAMDLGGADISEGRRGSYNFIGREAGEDAAVLANPPRSKVYGNQADAGAEVASCEE